MNVNAQVGLLVLSENRVVDRNPKRRGEVKKSYKNPWSRSPPPSVFFLKSQKNKPEFQSRTLYISTYIVYISGSHIDQQVST